MKTWSYRLKGMKGSRMHCLHRYQFSITTSYLQNVFIVFGITECTSGTTSIGSSTGISGNAWRMLLQSSSLVMYGYVMPSLISSVAFFSRSCLQLICGQHLTIRSKVYNGLHGSRLEMMTLTTPHRPLEMFHVQQ